MSMGRGVALPLEIALSDSMKKKAAAAADPKAKATCKRVEKQAGLCCTV